MKNWYIYKKNKNIFNPFKYNGGIRYICQLFLMWTSKSEIDIFTI